MPTHTVLNGPPERKNFCWSSEVPHGASQKETGGSSHRTDTRMSFGRSSLTRKLLTNIVSSLKAALSTSDSHLTLKPLTNC